MPPAPPLIDQLVINERASLLGSGLASVTIGLALDDGRVYWGDCLPVDGLDVASPTVRRLVDLCAQRLKGQPLVGFRHSCRQIHPVFPPTGRMPLADSVRGALEQGLLAAVASTLRLAELEVLEREYELKGNEWENLQPQIIVETNDFDATPEGIGRLMAIRPHGIGYRLTSDLVAESIGAEAEYLVTFVGELVQLSRQIPDFNPIIYLGLNGALGRLTDDPVRDIGKILSICRNLENVAGECQLMLEDVFILGDSAVQVANYRRLKKLLIRAPRPPGAKQAQLIANARTIGAEGIPLYIDAQDVDSIIFEPLRTASIDETMIGLSYVSGTGIGHGISFASRSDGYAIWPWLNTVSTLSVATSSQTIIVNQSDDIRAVMDLMNRQLAKARFSEAR